VNLSPGARIIVGSRRLLLALAAITKADLPPLVAIRNEGTTNGP
jgi:hypothetical protein